MKRTLFLFTFAFFAFFSFSQNNSFYIDFVENHNKQIFSKLFSTDLEKLEIGQWYISSEASKGDIVVLLCQVKESLYSKTDVKLIFYKKIPIGISKLGGIINSSEYIIYSNSSLSKIFIEEEYAWGERDYETLITKASNYINGNDVYFKSLGIEKARWQLSSSYYSEYQKQIKQKEKERLAPKNFKSYYDVMALHKKFKERYSPKGKLVYFSSKIEYESYEFSKNSNSINVWEQNDYSYKPSGKTSVREVTLLKNNSSDTIIILGVQRTKDGEFYDKSIVIFPNIVIEKIKIEKELNFDQLDFGTYFYSADYAPKNVPEDKNWRRQGRDIYQSCLVEFYSCFPRINNEKKETDLNTDKASSANNSNIEKNTTKLYDPKSCKEKAYNMAITMGLEIASWPRKYTGILKNTSHNLSSSCTMTISQQESNINSSTVKYRLQGSVDDVNLFGRWNLSGTSITKDCSYLLEFKGDIDFGYEGSAFPRGTKAPITFSIQVTKNKISGTYVLGVFGDNLTEQYGTFELN